MSEKDCFKKTVSSCFNDKEDANLVKVNVSVFNKQSLDLVCGNSEMFSLDVILSKHIFEFLQQQDNKKTFSQDIQAATILVFIARKKVQGCCYYFFYAATNPVFWWKGKHCGFYSLFHEIKCEKNFFT